MSVARVPCVVKADGLAAGKGVFMCHTREELEAALRAVATLGDQFVIEELLEGEELSVFAIVDGGNVLALPESRDYSRVGDGDTGPNTGGMGSYSPVPELSAGRIAELVDAIHRPVVETLAERDTPFIGCLYVGLMLTDDGPRVLEFNARFGDPEAELIVVRMKSDLVPVLQATLAERLDEVAIEWLKARSVAVVLAAGGYPGEHASGNKISGIEAADALEGVQVFHAGTQVKEGAFVTAGGRVLAVTAVGGSFAEAAGRCYGGAEAITFEGKHFRKDIARDALEAM